MAVKIDVEEVMEFTSEESEQDSEVVDTDEKEALENKDKAP